MTRLYRVRMGDGKVATCIAMHGEGLEEVRRVVVAMFGADRVEEVKQC